MAITFKSLRNQISKDMDEEEWLSLFVKAKTIRYPTAGCSARTAFINAMMALPSANLDELAFDGGISDWSGLQENPMLPLWVESASPSLMLMVNYEISHIVRKIGNDKKLYSMQKSSESRESMDRIKTLKKSSMQMHNCFVRTVRQESAWWNFSVDGDLVQRFSLGHAYVMGMRAVYEEPTFPNVLAKTKMLFVLARCFGLPRPKTILSFLMEDNS